MFFEIAEDWFDSGSPFQFCALCVYISQRITNFDNTSEVQSGPSSFLTDREREAER